MEVAELKMVRWALEVTRKDKIRNKYVRGTAKFAKLGDKLCNARLHWYGHVKKREDYVGKRMMAMAVPGRRKRGRPRRRWMDARKTKEKVKLGNVDVDGRKTNVGMDMDMDVDGARECGCGLCGWKEDQGEGGARERDKVN